MAPPDAEKPPFRWKVFWVVVAVTFVVFAVLATINPFGLFSSI